MPCTALRPIRSSFRTPIWLYAIFRYRRTDSAHRVHPCSHVQGRSEEGRRVHLRLALVARDRDRIHGARHREQAPQAQYGSLACGGVSGPGPMAYHGVVLSMCVCHLGAFSAVSACPSSGTAGSRPPSARRRWRGWLRVACQAMLAHPAMVGACTRTRSLPSVLAAQPKISGCPGPDYRPRAHARFLARDRIPPGRTAACRHPGGSASRG
jgi:hypothetical protein